MAGLLAASGVILMIHPQMATTGHLAVNKVPSSIFGVIIGLGIVGLGVAKGIRTARTAVAAAR